jgi:1-phosphofructokinase/6-phosphofructokinase 2
MILTVTPNPSLDLLFTADRLVWDDANRLADPRRRPGGQGINVARAVRVLGGDALAVALLGGCTGDEIRATLRAEGTPLRAVPASAETRLFIGVHQQTDGRSLLLNARGAERTLEEAENLLEETARAVRETSPSWVAGCGSLPPGFPDDFYVLLAAVAHAAGARFVADCDGPALRAAAPQCDLLVPNRHEAARLLGLDELPDVDDAARAAQVLIGLARTPLAAITMGEEGAVIAWPEGVAHAQPPRIPGASAVGAGDAFLARLLMGQEAREAPSASLAGAAAAGAAVLCGQGVALLVAADATRLAAATDVFTTVGRVLPGGQAKP